MISIEDYRKRLGLAESRPQALVFSDDGQLPNNPLPVLVYRSRATGAATAAADFEALFEHNGWPAQWRGGVFDFHHYHSVSHEVLGVIAGRAALRLGGEQGETLEVGAGDVLLLPAGVGHCRVHADSDFVVTAGYPTDQQNWDLCRVQDTAIAAARARVAAVRRPDADPVFGQAGGIAEYWHPGRGPDR